MHRIIERIRYNKGNDLILLACHDCETIFEFIDVKYKN